MEWFALTGSHDIKASILSFSFQSELQRRSRTKRTFFAFDSVGRGKASNMLGGNEDCDGDCHGQEGFLGAFNTFLSGSDSHSSQMLEIWIFSVMGTILVGLSGLFPLLIVPLESGPALKYGEPAKKLRLMLSFAVGSLLGDVFLHLLPEVWAHMDKGSHDSHTKIGLWVITGLLAFMIVEKLMGDKKLSDDTDSSPDTLDSPPSQDALKQILNTETKIHQCESSNGNGQVHHRKIQNSAKQEPGEKEAKKSVSVQENKIKISGYLNLLANVVDNFTHGLAVGASFCISIKVGLATTLAILLHEIPHEVGDFAILLRSGFDWWKAAKAQFLTASGGVFGAVTALTAESSQAAGQITACILPFTSGGFMYIALVTVVPDLLEEKQGWESFKQIVCVCFGVLSMILVTVIFET